METLIFSRDERHIEMKTLDAAMFTILLEKFPEDTEAQLLFLQNEFTYVRPFYAGFGLHYRSSTIWSFQISKRIFIIVFMP